MASADQQYAQLVERVLREGEVVANRTGVDAKRITGASLRFDLSDGTFPILTTKQVAWKSVVAELLLFIGGRTDNAELQSQNVHIWDLNATPELTAAKSLPENDLGPVYGFQWRHWGAAYQDCHTDYSSQGIDQLRIAIEQLTKSTMSRQIVVSAWNPEWLHKMALPPCHFAFQFINVDDRLDCVLYQRSGDIGLGIPFNIASYALLMHIVANITDLRVGTLAHFVGDAHVYVNHIDPLTEQIQREPHKGPTLKIRRKLSLDDITADDFELVGYKHHPRVKMQMAA